MCSRPSTTPLSLRLACLFLCSLLVATSAFITVHSAAIATGKDTSQQKRAALNNANETSNSMLPAMPQGVTGVGDLGYNLPNLDSARLIQPTDPTPPPPIPSNQPCPDCTTNCLTCNAGNFNHPPVATAGGPNNSQVGQSINFYGMASFDSDPNDRITSYQWNFGDSTSSSGPAPTHIYASPGNYTVTLTVVDTHNLSATDSRTVTVNPASTPPSSTPTGQGNAAIFVRQSVPSQMDAGASYPISVTMRNNGTTNWTAARLYRLGSQNPGDNTTWSMDRVAVPSVIAPGAEVTFNFTVVAPGSVGGTCCGDEDPPSTATNFEWRMVQDGVEWFGEQTTNVPVTVNGNSHPGHSDTPYSTGPHNLSSSRLAPRSRTGQPGEDLNSGNFN
jgi:PKD repeat protein